MKKLNHILFYTFAICFSLYFTACDEDKRDWLDLSGEVKIESFTINGTEAIIDESKGTIQVMLPLGTDLTKLSPNIVVSKGANVTPEDGQLIDLSKAKKFRVTNGNLYNDYTVVATHIKGEILSFAIGKYKGIIDETTNKIHVRVPQSTDVTNLTPEFMITKGATVTPNLGITQNFSTPVIYTIEYMDQTFTYEITVEKANIKPIAFLGTAPNASSIENMDEKTAYQWFSNTMPDYQYVSFNDVKNGNVDLSQFVVVWWYLEATNVIPLVATEASVLTSLKAYYENGGSFLFSSWAVQYVAPLGIPKDGKSVNNLWGENNTPFVIDDNWGLCFTGNEAHPIYAGLQKPIGVNNKVYLLSKGVKAKAHNAIWNFTEDWVEYKSAEAWTVGNGGICLASFHWDDSGKGRALVFEYPKSGKKGGVICIGGESYDWYNEDGSVANIYRENIEIFTSNIFNYLSK